MGICLLIILVLITICETVSCYHVCKLDWERGEPDITGTYIIGAIISVGFGVWTYYFYPDCTVYKALKVLVSYSIIGMVFSFFRGCAWLVRNKRHIHERYMQDKYDAGVFKNSSAYQHAKEYFLSMIKVWAFLWPLFTVLLITADFIDSFIDWIHALYNNLFDTLLSDFKSKKFDMEPDKENK